MKINTNIIGWLRLLLLAGGAAYLWRSSFFPKKNEPKGYFDRVLRIFGAVLLTTVVIYFMGYGLGFYGLFGSKQK